MDLGRHAASIGSLADRKRRELYDYVSGQPDPVSREQAATALGMAQHNVSFHLDRLVEEGLLEVDYRRLSGRSGPGAGRPSKLYRRAEREFSVSLPPRRYDLAGEILASAIGRAEAGGSLQDAVRDAARDEGLALAREAQPVAPDDPLPGLADALRTQGYEPRVDDAEIVLANCPFDALVHRHTALVCGLNQAFVQGVADGVGACDVTACLDPEPGRCCVLARREAGLSPVRAR